ncbi:HTH domain-containing protein [Zobellia sp. B3R18]|nr:HTH domain-containing protein [Zobellia sp. B3R18]
MKSIKNLERLQQLHLLIENERTGSPRELGRRMHISERLVYKLIDYLKDYDAQISYDRGRKTYYYREDFFLEVKVSVSVKSKNEVIELYGGGYI